MRKMKARNVIPLFPRLCTLSALAATAVVVLNACAEGRADPDKPGPEAPAARTGTEDKAPEPPSSTEKPKVVKSEEEWRKLLTPEQFRVARMAGTERPYGEAYKEFKHQGEGTYYCLCCGAELFTSKTKFDSGCGWPSFYGQSEKKNVIERRDFSLGMIRVEVLCGVCDAHLGHVFEGEGFDTPTDRRYCINAVSMTFVPKGGKPPAPKGAAGKKEAEDAPPADTGSKSEPSSGEDS